MRPKLLFTTVLVLGAFVTLSNGENVNATTEEDNGAFLKGIRFDLFDLHLCQSLYSAASPSSNVAVSPVSVKLILAMLYEAARGSTATELQQSLGLPQSKRECRVKFGAIQRSLNAPSEFFELKSASRIFIPPHATYSESYARVLRKYFSAGMEMVDFTKPHEAAKIVNKWVSEATNGKILQMLDPNDPQIPKLNLILSNALFFKGLWENPFDPKHTIEGKFYLSDGNTINVPTMQNSRDTFYFAENRESGYRILRLPYTGNKYSLYIVLPMERNGLPGVLPKLSPEEIRNTMTKLKPTLITLRLPKFTFQFAVDLEPILKTLGIEKMFMQDEADFPWISNNTKVYVSRILHKAGLEVNELGSTVHAATNVNMGTRFINQDDEIFNVDHPFVFFIKDDTAATIVFAAKVENPLMKPNAGGSVPSVRIQMPPSRVINYRNKQPIQRNQTETEQGDKETLTLKKEEHKIVKKHRTRRQNYTLQHYNFLLNALKDSKPVDKSLTRPVHEQSKRFLGLHYQSSHADDDYNNYDGDDYDTQHRHDYRNTFNHKNNPRNNYGRNNYGPYHYGPNNYGPNNYGPGYNHLYGGHKRYNFGPVGYGPNYGPSVMKRPTTVKLPSEVTRRTVRPFIPTAIPITPPRTIAPVTTAPTPAVITDIDYDGIFGTPPPTNPITAGPQVNLNRPDITNTSPRTPLSNQDLVNQILTNIVPQG